MHYIILALSLFIIEILYIYLATKLNIIDKPNHRSSHNGITIRGGGIIFTIAYFFYIIYFKHKYLPFSIGITLLTITCIIDDIKSVPSLCRLIVQICSAIILLLVFPLENFSWIYYFLYVIFIVCGLNAFNFMDGINGITATYSITVLFSLLYVNQQKIFIENNLIIVIIISVLVFGFFNFRKKAKVFAGDVGSIVIGFIIMFFLIALIAHSKNYLYILFIIVYGVDTSMTLLIRLRKGEKISQPHRSHLFQLLANDAKIPQLIVSIAYGLFQGLINIYVITITDKSLSYSIFAFIIIAILLCSTYLVVRNIILSKLEQVKM